MAQSRAQERLIAIRPEGYPEPADRAASAAWRAVPLPDTVVGTPSTTRYGHAVRQPFPAGAIEGGPDQLPGASESSSG
jgi:hypothetical protein